LAAGRSVLAYLRQRSLVQAADCAQEGSAGHVLASTLRTLSEDESVGDVRGIGLLWGVEFVSDKNSKQPYPPELNFSGRTAAAAVKRGLLVYPVQGCADGTRGDHLLIAPPAVITAEEIHCAVEQLREAIREVAENA